MMETDHIGLIIVAIVMAVVLSVFIPQLNRCNDKGGVMVKAAFWYECVEPKK